jgi:hypothetical protein
MTEFSVDLIKVYVPNPALVFVEGGSEAIITAIQEKARSVVLDITTPQGRKDTASLAHQVARSKTFLDDAGKTFISKIKGQVKIVDNERKNVRDSLGALKDEIRAPLTAWEDAKQKREGEIEYNISHIKSFGKDRDDIGMFYKLEELEFQLADLAKIEPTEEGFGDRVGEALQAHDRATTQLNAHIEKSKKEEADRLELEKLRAEKEEREEKERVAKVEQERVDREERIAKEATEQAEEDAKERTRKIIADNEQKRIDAENAKIDAEKRVIEAKENAQRDADEAVAREKERVAEANRNAEAIKAKREKDQKHKDYIHNEIATAIAMRSSLGMSIIVELINEISEGKIPFIKIEY